MKSDFGKIRRKISEFVLDRLQKDCPKMPAADRNEIRRLVLWKYSDFVGKAALQGLTLTIRAYVRDQYTPFKSLPEPLTLSDAEARSKLRQRIDKELY